MTVLFFQNVEIEDASRNLLIIGKHCLEVSCFLIRQSFLGSSK